MTQRIRGKIPRSDWHNTQHLNAWKAQMRRSFDNFSSAIYGGFVHYSYDVPADWNQEQITLSQVRVLDTAAKTMKCRKCKKTRSIIYYDPYFNEKMEYILPQVCSTCRGRPAIDPELTPKRSYWDPVPPEERIQELARRYQVIRRRHRKDDDYDIKESLFDDKLFGGPLPGPPRDIRIW